MGVVALAVAVVLVAVAVRYFLNFIAFWLNLREQWKAAAKFPGGTDRGHWLLGSLHRIKKVGPSVMLKEMRERAISGMRVYVTWTTSLKPTFVLIHPDTARNVLTTAEPKAKQWNGIYGVVENWLGDGLIMSSGPKWRRNRRLLNPAFHSSVLKPYFKVYNKAAQKFAESILKSEDEFVDTQKLSTLFSLEVILRCAYSYPNDVQGERNEHPYASTARRLAHLVIKRMAFIGPEFLYKMTADGREFYRLVKNARVYSDTIVSKRKEELNNETSEKTGSKYVDFLDLLLRARDSDGCGLSDEEIRAEVDTLLFAGHDTTATLLTFSFYALAKYPAIQEKVFAEVRERLGTRETVVFEDLYNLPYTGMFVKEVLRVYSPLTGISRDLSQPAEIDGVLLPKNSRISIGLHHIHHNGDVWDNPQEFQPERFSRENWSGRNPYMFVPFSAGPRNCIGQNMALHEAKVAICQLIRRFSILPKPGHVLVTSTAIVHRSTSGAPLKFTPRVDERPLQTEVQA